MTRNANVDCHVDSADKALSVIVWTHSGTPSGGFFISDYLLHITPRATTMLAINTENLHHGSHAPEEGTGTRIGVALTNNKRDVMRCATLLRMGIATYKTIS